MASNALLQVTQFMLSNASFVSSDSENILSSGSYSIEMSCINASRPLSESDFVRDCENRPSNLAGLKLKTKGCPAPF